MRINSSYIYIRRIHLHAFHGVMPQERQVGADFLVSLRVKYNFAQAAATDDVADTLSYADLFELVRREMATPSKLLEHVAGRIAEKVCQTWPQVEEVMVQITKQNPPMGADCDGAGVEIHLINDKTKA